MQLRTISATTQVAALNQNFLTRVFMAWVSVGRSIDTIGAVAGAVSEDYAVCFNGANLNFWNLGFARAEIKGDFEAKIKALCKTSYCKMPNFRG